MHRPDAAAHRKCAAHQPEPEKFSLYSMHAARQIEGNVGRDGGYHPGKDYQPDIVNAFHILLLRIYPTMQKWVARPLQ
jgi:hypothetical protein